MVFLFGKEFWVETVVFLFGKEFWVETVVFFFGKEFWVNTTWPLYFPLRKDNSLYLACPFMAV